MSLEHWSEQDKDKFLLNVFVKRKRHHFLIEKVRTWANLPEL